MTEKQKFYALIALVCEDLVGSAVDTLVRKGHEASSSQLNAVRHGRQINLPWLIDLVRIGLPDFAIPPHLLPVVRTAAPVPLGI